MNERHDIEKKSTRQNATQLNKTRCRCDTPEQLPHDLPSVVILNVVLANAVRLNVVLVNVVLVNVMLPLNVVTGDKERRLGLALHISSTSGYLIKLFYLSQ